MPSGWGGPGATACGYAFRRSRHARVGGYWNRAGQARAAPNAAAAAIASRRVIGRVEIESLMTAEDYWTGCPSASGCPLAFQTALGGYKAAPDRPQEETHDRCRGLPLAPAAGAARYGLSGRPGADRRSRSGGGGGGRDRRMAPQDERRSPLAAGPPGGQRPRLLRTPAA